MAVDSISSDRNYTSMLNGGTTGKVYNAVFGDEDDSDLTINDFFNLMITQLTNQDFMNPMDDTEYMSQMAQFATMQEMMDLCQYSKQNYVMSMLGKEVTIGKNMIGGSTESVTGVVEKIVLEDDEYKIYIDGKPYDLSKVTQISAGKNESSDNADNSEVENETKADG
ncbi:MAG: flagellar hook capping protein [Oscillospiraceae bacterium]|nr:flagellar hook capping protein [Oscillospiraceae bacterium]